MAGRSRQVECPERGASAASRRASEPSTAKASRSFQCPRSPSRCPTVRAVAARRCYAWRRCGRRSLRVWPRRRWRRRRRQAGRSDVPAAEDSAGTHRDAGQPRGAAALSAQHGAPAGGGRHQSLSRRAVRHRSGDRRRVLLRLRRRSAVRARGSRRDRKEDEGAGGRGSASTSGRCGRATKRSGSSRRRANRSRCS